MANGPRIVRQAGLKRSSGLDNLMQVLNLTGGIAQNIQQNRNQRQAFDLKMIDLYAGDFQNEFSNERLNKSIKQLEEYSTKNQDRFSADTTEILQALKTKMQTQWTANDNFAQDTLKLQGISSGSDALLDDLYAWDSLSPEDQQSKILAKEKDSVGVLYTDNYGNAKREGLTSMIEEYGKLKTDLGLHDERRMNNAFWMKLGDTERSLNGMLAIAKSENKISEKEYNVFDNVLKTGWTQEADNFVAQQTKAMTNAQGSVFNDLEKQRGLLQSNLDILDSGTRPVAVKDIPAELKLDEDGLDMYADLSGTDTVDVNLNDGSRIATYYKDQMIENIAKYKDEIESKFTDYIGQVGLNYTRMNQLDKKGGVFDRADAHISGYGANVEGYLRGDDIDPPSTGDEGEGDGIWYQSDATGVKKDYTDYSSNIADLRPGARASVEPLIKRRTNDLNNYIELIDNIKIGEGLIAGTEAQRQFANATNLNVEDVKGIYKFYREKFPKSQDASHEWVIEESMRGLRQILNVGVGESGNYDRNSYQYISNAPLSFEELTEIKKIYDEDKKAYDLVMSNKKILEDSGETKTPEYVDLLKKEALFSQKWLGGTSVEHGAKKQNVYTDPYTGELKKAESPGLFGAGIWGSGNPGKIKGMEDALTASLSFYYDFLPSQANKKSEQLEKIITQSSVGEPIKKSNTKKSKKDSNTAKVQGLGGEGTVHKSFFTKPRNWDMPVGGNKL